MARLGDFSQIRLLFIDDLLQKNLTSDESQNRLLDASQIFLLLSIVSRFQVYHKFEFFKRKNMKRQMLDSILFITMHEYKCFKSQHCRLWITEFIEGSGGFLNL